MRILVTGHRGYLGTVLTRLLCDAQFEVLGLDCDLYEGCDFTPPCDVRHTFQMDLRDVEASDLDGIDAVIHLAALPEDWPGTLDPELIEQVNFEATMQLAACAKRAGVSRFVLASTCAVYGRGAGLLHEESPVEPLTPYARGKLRCERGITRLADDAFFPIFLRNATLCGVSPRLRLDTVVNDFVAAAVTTGRITMKTAGQAWRPLVHVEDAARAFAAALTAPRDAVHNQVINVVSTNENYRVGDIAAAVIDEVPGSTLAPAARAVDPRSYRVAGDKLARVLPGVRLARSLPDTIRQLRDALAAMGMTAGDWRSDRYRRVLRLAAEMETGHLDGDLRPCERSMIRRRPRQTPVPDLALAEL